MSLGYWKDARKTADAFITVPGHADVYYRTGDRVRRPRSGAPLIHLGRIDSQIKVLGHRVELGEIEAVVRKHCGSDTGFAAWRATTTVRCVGRGGILILSGGEASCHPSLSYPPPTAPRDHKTHPPP